MPTAWPRAQSLSPSLFLLSLSLSLSARLQLISTLSNLSLSTVSCLAIHLIFMRSKMLRPRSPPQHGTYTFCSHCLCPVIFHKQPARAKEAFHNFPVYSKTCRLHFSTSLPLSLSLSLSLLLLPLFLSLFPRLSVLCVLWNFSHSIFSCILYYAFA